MDQNTKTDKDESKKTCRMSETDESGRPNLCCCYIVKDDGSYEDPCYHPADSCC